MSTFCVGLIVNSTIPNLGEVCLDGSIVTSVTFLNKSNSTDLFFSKIGRSYDLDEIWVLFCAFLVFFMQLGFTMLETGVVREQHVLHILFKNFVDTFYGGLAWYVLGHSIAFGNPNNNNNNSILNILDEFIGLGTSNMVLSSVDDSEYQFWFFHLAFATSATTIVSGAVAERCTLTAYACYTLFLTGWLYPVVVHWVWDVNGWLSAVNENALVSGGVIDFAGGGVVHMVGGLSGLIGTLFLGPRFYRFNKKYSQYSEYVSNNISWQVLGMFILWFCWYGFNCGSTLNARGYLASKIAVNTTLGAAGGGLISALMSSKIDGYWSVPRIVNGILAGMVSVTSSCAVISPTFAVITGIIGCIIYYCTSVIIAKLYIDDPLDAFALHGMGGLWSLLSVAVFANPKDIIAAGFMDITANQSKLDHLLNQSIAAISIICWVSLNAILLFGILKYKGILKYPFEVEALGLDNAKEYWGKVEPHMHSIFGKMAVLNVYIVDTKDYKKDDDDGKEADLEESISQHKPDSATMEEKLIVGINDKKSNSINDIDSPAPIEVEPNIVYDNEPPTRAVTMTMESLDVPGGRNKSNYKSTIQRDASDVPDLPDFPRDFEGKNNPMPPGLKTLGTLIKNNSINENAEMSGEDLDTILNTTNLDTTEYTTDQSLATEQTRGKSVESSEIIGGSRIESKKNKNYVGTRNVKQYLIKNPLVAICGIGDYDKDIMPNLIGMTTDYCNWTYSFYKKLGYSVIYQTNNSDADGSSIYRCWTTNPDGSRPKLNLDTIAEEAKIRWIEDEIYDFFEHVKKLIVDNKYDSGIFIIAAHGETENVILDSEGEEVGLIHIFDRFNGKNCPYLINKPKIVFVDACRGDMAEKPIEVDESKSNTNNNNNNNNEGSITTTMMSQAKDGNVSNQKVSGKNKKFSKHKKRRHRRKKLFKTKKAKKHVKVKEYRHKMVNFIYIFGNPDGFAVADGGKQGGYLTRAARRVFDDIFSNKKIISKSFDDIFIQIQSEISSMVGSLVAQVAQVVSTMTFKVIFVKNKPNRKQ